MGKSVVRVPEIWLSELRREVGAELESKCCCPEWIPTLENSALPLLISSCWHLFSGGVCCASSGNPQESFGSKPERGLPWRRFSFLSWDASDLPSRDQRPATFHKAVQLDPAHPVLISSTTCCGAEGTTVCLWDAWEGCRRHKSNLSSAWGTRRTGWILHPSLRYSLPW